MRILYFWIAFTFASLPMPIAAALPPVNGLFDIKIPAWPKEYARVNVPKTGDCSLKPLDFRWYKPETNTETKPNGLVRCHVLNQLGKAQAVASTNKAGCPLAARQNRKCFDQAYNVPELSMVQSGLTDKSVVVRSYPAAGQCVVKAYVDLSGNQFQIDFIDTAGKLLGGSVLSGQFEVEVSHIVVSGKMKQGDTLMPVSKKWPCVKSQTQSCVRKLEFGLSCQLVNQAS